jgi:hypothetical protein
VDYVRQVLSHRLTGEDSHSTPTGLDWLPGGPFQRIGTATDPAKPNYMPQVDTDVQIRYLGACLGNPASPVACNMALV